MGGDGCYNSMGVNIGTDVEYTDRTGGGVIKTDPENSWNDFHENTP